MFLLNSRLGLFTAALSGLHPNRAPLLEVTGSFLPSSLTRVLSLTLGFSLIYLCRFAVRAVLLFLEAFLDSVKSGTSVLNFLPHHSSCFARSGFAYFSHSLLGRTFPFVRFPILLCHPSVKQLALVQESLPVVHRLRLSASA